MAQKPNKLTQFHVEPFDDGYRLLIEDDAGERVEFELSAEQLEIIADELDDILADSED